MADSDIVLKNLTKARLRRLLNMFCVHAIEYHQGHYVCHWEKCNACILCDIPWKEDEVLSGFLVRANKGPISFIGSLYCSKPNMTCQLLLIIPSIKTPGHTMSFDFPGIKVATIGC